MKAISRGFAVMLVGMGLVLAGCGPASRLHVTEYALVEQSQDQPGSASFAGRIPQAVAQRQAAFGSPAADLDVPNRLLAPFGIRIAANPSPPYGGYALYSGDTLVQRHITRAWPVSLAQDGADFLLAYETVAGEHLMLSQAGVQPWPGASAQSGVAPVYYRDSIAYAQVGQQLTIVSDSGLLYSGAGAVQPRNLITWANGQHWALIGDGDVIADGQSLAAAQGAEDIFGWQLLGEQPFYLYTRQGVTRIHFAGSDLPNPYDLVLHDQPAALAQYNPGGGERAAWFYALRDGLWYYVEITLP